MSNKNTDLPFELKAFMGSEESALQCFNHVEVKRYRAFLWFVLLKGGMSEARLQELIKHPTCYNKQDARDLLDSINWETDS